MRRVENAVELLDEQRHDMAELEQSLGHVASVNRWLGGVRAVLTHVRPLLRPNVTLRILDLATGSADIPVAIAREAKRKRAHVEITAADIHPQILEIAAKRCKNFADIHVQQADALALPFDDKRFNVSILSMALHHFEAGDQITVLREMSRVTRDLVIVNDLERTRLNYVGAKLLSMTLWRGNRLTRHDGPLSVLRSFTPRELEALARNAGMRGNVVRHFFQRIVLEAEPGTASSAAVNTE